MANELFYTFSTIAQALGGAIALLAAFVLYRLQSIESALWEDTHALLGSMFTAKDLTIFFALRGAGDYAGLRREMQRAIAEHKPTTADANWPFGPELRGRYVHLCQATDDSERIKKALWSPLWVTGGVMAYSVAWLPFVHLISEKPCIAWPVVIAGALGFIGCLLLYVRLIRTALG